MNTVFDRGTGLTGKTAPIPAAGRGRSNRRLMGAFSDRAAAPVWLARIPI